MNNPHPNILRFIERFRSRDHLMHYIVMDLVPLGDLFLLLQETNGQGDQIWKPVKPQYCRHLIKGVALGLKHLFSLGIGHGDLKLENILISSIGGEDISRSDYFKMVPKLIDFNNSIMVEPGSKSLILITFPIY